MPVFCFYAFGRTLFNTKSHSFSLDTRILLIGLSCQPFQNPSEFCKHLIHLNTALEERTLGISWLKKMNKRMNGMNEWRRRSTPWQPKIRILLNTPLLCGALMFLEFQNGHIFFFWSVSNVLLIVLAFFPHEHILERELIYYKLEQELVCFSPWWPW